MLLLVLVGLAAVVATVLTHAVGTAWWLKHLRQRRLSASTFQTSRILTVLMQTAIVLIALHTIEVATWAVILRFLPDGGLATFEEALYFSFTTFSTLGYGDITLAGPWRMLTGIESLNGVLLLGWSTALSFAVIQRAWEGNNPSDQR